MDKKELKEREAKVIELDLLKISQLYDSNFSLKEIAEHNPFSHLRMSNGFIFFE